MLGLGPQEFWRLTLSEFNLMVEAKLEEERRQAARKAIEIWANIYGQRCKKPDPRKLMKMLVDAGKPFDREEFSLMIEESNRRAKAVAKEEQ